MTKDEIRLFDDVKGRLADSERRIEALESLPVIQTALRQVEVDRLTAESAEREKAIVEERTRLKADREREQVRLDPPVVVTYPGLRGAIYAVSIGDPNENRWFLLSALDERPNVERGVPVRHQESDQVAPFRWIGRLSDWQALVALSGSRLARDAESGMIVRVVHADPDAVRADPALLRGWTEAKAPEQAK